MILFEKGLEIKDETAAMIGDKEYIESELLKYVLARAKSGIINVRTKQAKQEAEDTVKDVDVVIKSDAIVGEVIKTKP